MLDEQTTPLGGNTGSVTRVLQILLRRVGTIMLVAVVTTGSALGFSLSQAPTYQASVKILVGQRNTEATNLSPGDVSALQDLTQTVAEGADTTPVAQAVVEQLNLPEQSPGEV